MRSPAGAASIITALLIATLFVTGHYMYQSGRCSKQLMKNSAGVVAGASPRDPFPGSNFINSELIPKNSIVDMNIGTNLDPIVAKPGTHRILIDPLFYVCDSNAKIAEEVTAFCFAVSNYTGFTTFYEYNKNGASSSLSKVSAGTSHERFSVKAKRTVLVLEANTLFSSISNRNTTINRLKLDMQGYELTTLRNIRELLENPTFILNVHAECFCSRKDNGKQIYEIDNSCNAIDALLQESGFETSGGVCENGEWSDIVAHKKGLGLKFLPSNDWAGERPHDALS